MKEFRKIILATDFSECSQLAMEYAKSFAKKYNAKLLLLHVFDPQGPKMPAPYLVAGLASWLEKNTPAHLNEARTLLEQLYQSCVADEVSCERHLLEGHPSEEIVKFIYQQKADFVVLGSHGYTGWEKRVLGSIADYVMRATNCPVFIVRNEKSPD